MSRVPLVVQLNSTCTTSMESESASLTTHCDKSTPFAFESSETLSITKPIPPLPPEVVYKISSNPSSFQ
ncbi:hypothetical protein HanXRQr2_Chr02g0079441 [Helianthus annuus]|uniref:Uncharacterized protein n=1 Tax=Helianthus annuus TaxID=4232 RepID=A0A9K3JPW3_HELAN|nr:hypothetical protein HanXRQr2_Chr02g0079441 [Helianthus annuus]KAJ0952851.1 hypothetical protein HanPSC8_Chr02g0077131 [Helianthus annuus]